MDGITMQKELRCRNMRIVDYLLKCKISPIRTENDAKGAVYVFAEDDRCMTALYDFKKQNQIAYY